MDISQPSIRVLDIRERELQITLNQRLQRDLYVPSICYTVNSCLIGEGWRLSINEDEMGVTAF